MSGILSTVKLLFSPAHVAENWKNLSLWFRALADPGAIEVWSSHFDPAFYLNLYPDVRAARVDPFLHFLLSGNRERRNPSPRFDSADYLGRYVDVETSRVNALLHFALWGAAEGRRCEAVAAAPGNRASQIPARIHSVTINNAWPSGAPLVSVVIPCFNYGHYLGASIDSVLRQTFQNFEIIVVEGGSTDAASVAEVRRLHATSIPKTRFYFRENRSLVGDNRNFGIGLARGRYICCLDADDLLQPIYLEVAVFLAEAFGFDAVSPSLQAFGESEIQWIVGKASFPEIFENNQMTTLALFRRSVWAHIGGFRDWGLGDEYVYEDWDFWIRLLGHGFLAEYIRQPLMLYRMHTSGMSSQSGAHHREVLRAANSDLVRAPLPDSDLIPGSDLMQERRILNRLINLHGSEDTTRKCLLLAVPFLWTRTNADKVVEIAVALVERGERLIVTTSEPNVSSFQQETELGLFTSSIYHLSHLFHCEEHAEDFVKYLIHHYRPTRVVVAGCHFMAGLLPALKAEFPDLCAKEYASPELLDSQAFLQSAWEDEGPPSAAQNLGALVP